MKEKKGLLTKDELSNVTAGENEPAPVYCEFWRTCRYFDPRLCIIPSGTSEVPTCAAK